MRTWIVPLAAAVFLSACGAEPSVEPSPTRQTVSSAASPSALSPASSPSPSPSPEPFVPGEMPTTFARDLEPVEVPPEALVPKAADVTGQWFGFTDDGVVILVSWVEAGPDVDRLPGGFAVWRRATSRPFWRTALVERHGGEDGITEIQASTTDVTGDASDDALVFEGLGGSGACGRWLVIDLLRVEKVFADELCDGRIDPGPPEAPGLVITRSVFLPGDAHCCPSRIRETTLAWTGQAWHVTSTTTRAA